jgi:short-subunit dehydrogenase
MTLAGVERPTKDQPWKEATAEGIKQSVDIAAAAMTGNYVGPLVAAVALVPTTSSFSCPNLTTLKIPLLTNSSTSPSIVLISSVAGVIPAPTRALYASSKGASLLLYQSLAIEHPSIAFTLMLPGTIEGDFRASAVDASFGGVHEADPNKHGLSRETIAARVVRAVDRGDKAVWMPVLYRFAHALYWIWPSFIEHVASAKYNFAAK